MAAIALMSVVVTGCGSNPARVRREMQHYTDLKEYDNARAVKAKHNPGGIPQTKEEAVKEEMTRDVVNPAEIKDITETLTRKVSGHLAKNEFDAARDVVWTPIPGRVPEVDVAVRKVQGALLREEINRKQFVKVTNDLTRAVSSAVAAKDFKMAREAIAAVKPVRTYHEEIEKAVEAVGKTLLDAKVAETNATMATASAREFLEELFADNELKIGKRAPGGDFKPDDSGYQAKLKSFGEALTRQGVEDSARNKAVSALDDVATKGLHALWRPQESYDLAPPASIGTTKLNALIDEVKGALYTNIVVPAQIAHRAATLRAKIVPLVAKGQIAEAREAIYTFGVTGYPEIDDPVFAVKLGLLNARVNVAELEARSESLRKAVDAALANGDLDGATAIIAAAKPVPAYGAAIGKALDAAAAETVKLGADAAEAAEIISDTHQTLYSQIAPRPDEEREERIMSSYFEEVAGIESEKRGDSVEPDWSAVRSALDNAAGWLVTDDVSREDADALMADVLAGFQSLIGGKASGGLPALTTEELNKMLADLKAELSAKVSAAVAAKMAAEAKAASERAAAEANAAAARAAAEAKEAVAKAAAEAERMRQLALEMAERAAAAVDFDARINGFVEAVSDRVEPDVNRILGDGARILRLRRAGAQIGSADATSLLAASIYMGYDDVSMLALTLGADIDGSAAKDGLRRPIILLAMQYGYKGRAASILEQANRSKTDANGDGALHYAVRGGNGTALMELIRLGIDAKRPGAKGATPIVLAADLGYAGFVQALIPFSNIEKGDAEGFTALLRAAQNGRLDIVRNMVAAGADISAKTGEGDGVLELAAKANAPELLAWLLDEKRIAPTARAVSQLVIAGNVPTLQAMVAHGARLRDEHLAVAVKRGDFPMVKYLVNMGMDVNAESVLKVCREGGSGPAAGPNDGTYFGPDGESILEFLREQGQRL